MNTTTTTTYELTTEDKAACQYLLNRIRRERSRYATRQAAFDAICEDENYHGSQPDTLAIRVEVARLCRSNKARANIDPYRI